MAFATTTACGPGPWGDEKLRIFFENPNLCLDHCCAAALGRKIYFAVCEDGDGVNDALLEYDVGKQTYLIHRGVNANCFLVADGTILYGSQDGKIYRMGAQKPDRAKQPIGKRLFMIWERNIPIRPVPCSTPMCGDRESCLLQRTLAAGHGKNGSLSATSLPRCAFPSALWGEPLAIPSAMWRVHPLNCMRPRLLLK